MFKITIEVDEADAVALALTGLSGPMFRQWGEHVSVDDVGFPTIRGFNEAVLYKLDFPALEQGMQVFARDYPRHWADFRRGQADMITGDVFVQCCIFGEAKYG